MQLAPVRRFSIGGQGGEDRMRPSEKLREKRAEVLEIFSRYPLISNPRVFGSVARGEDREDTFAEQ